MIPKPINNGYTVYGIINCKYCKLAKDNILPTNKSFLFVNIEEYIDDYKEIFNNIDNINKNHNTVPIIFYDNEFIGGYEELVHTKSYNLNETTDF